MYLTYETNINPGEIIIPVSLADPQRDGNANFSNLLQDNAYIIRIFATRFDLQCKNKCNTNSYFYYYLSYYS